MLKYTVCNFYKVRNPSTSEAFGIAAGSSKVVALNPAFLILHGAGLLAAIQTQTVQVEDIRGNLMAPNRAGSAFIALQSEVNTFRNDLADAETFVSLAYGKAIRLHWNLSAQHTLMDLIGTDILLTDFTGLGTTRMNTVSKMGDAYSLLMAGMYQEAAAALGSIVPDGFFTVAKVAQYQEILLGADAFAVVL